MARPRVRGNNLRAQPGSLHEPGAKGKGGLGASQGNLNGVGSSFLLAIGSLEEPQASAGKTAEI